MAGIIKIDEISPNSGSTIQTDSVYINNSSCNTCIQIPNGNVSQRQSNPKSGSVRYNIELELLEIYDGYEWKEISESGADRKFLVDANFYSSGNVSDLSIYKNTGAINSTVVKSSSGGGSFEFSNDGYIEFDSIPEYNLAASNLTFMYWVLIDIDHNYTGANTGARPWVIQDRGIPGIESFIGSAGINTHTWFCSSNGSSWNVLDDFAPNVMTIGTWYFAAITRNYSNGSFISYWNGQATHSASNNSQFYYQLNGPGFRLGGNATYFIDGKIAKAKMMNVELTPSQINNIWLSEKSRFGY